MSNKEKFLIDLTNGNHGEVIVANYLKQKKGYKILNYNNDMDYDVKVELKGKELLLEIKTDMYEYYNETTNNMFIEMKCGGHNSGIKGTKADIFMYYFPDHEIVYWATVKDILHSIDIGSQPWSPNYGAGDGGRVFGVIINRFDQTLFKKIYINKEPYFELAGIENK